MSLPPDDRRGTLIALEPRIRAAFHPLYHEIARRKDLSAGAKVTYAVLCSYHQKFDDVFPGREKLVEDTGEPLRSLARYLKELQDIGLLSVKRRGLRMTNVYTLLAWPSGWANLARQEKP